VEVNAPRGPTDLSTRSWWRSARRTVKEFREDNLTDSAAALTYYSVLSLFPALVALVSIVGLFGDPRSTTRTLGELVSQVGPASATRTLRSTIESLTAHRSAAGVLLVVGIGASLWSASGYVGAFIRASNFIYEVREGRPFWKLRPLQLLVTLGMVLMLALVAIMLVVSGPVASAVGGAIGASDAAVTAWNIAKWPVLLAVVLTMFAVLYYVSPNVRLPGFRWITPGSLLALAAWVIASAGFAFYVAHFASYNRTYGTLGGAVTFLVWLWIGNLALLLGLELNAELERSRELARGQAAAERELQLKPRQPPS
jgi:membrane protein